MKASVQEVLKNTDLSQQKALGEIVYEAFRMTIIQGKIPFGERINEKEYSEIMNISRTPIRFALKILEKEGLVEHIPKVGVVVKEITKKDAIEIYAVRKALETVATETAMQLMTEEDFKELDDLLTQTEEKNAQGNVEDVIKLFNNFHEIIYLKSNTLRLREIVMNIQEYLSRFRRICLNTADRRDQAVVEHRLLYHAMVAKDKRRIQLLIEDHLNSSLAFVLQEMEKENQINESQTK